MNILHKIKCKIYRFLLKNGMLAPKVVLLMDGGVCSQMHQYLLGHLFGQKGYRVEYDLTFFKEWGSDMDYHFVRNFGRRRRDDDPLERDAVRAPAAAGHRTGLAAHHEL